MATFKQITLAQMFSEKEMELKEFAYSESLSEMWSQKVEIGKIFEETHILNVDALIFVTTELLSAYRTIADIFQNELDLLNEIRAEELDNG